MPTAFIFMMGFIPTVIEKLTFLFSFFSLLLVATRNKKSTYFIHSFLFETIEQPDQSVARLFGIHPIPYFL
jgi:hypothetical protein